MVGFEQLAARYFPELEPVNVWIKLAQYWTQKNDAVISYEDSHELFYSYLLFSLTENGFTLVIEEEKNFPTLRAKFGNFNEFVFLSTEDSAENQRKAIASIENNTAKTVTVSIERFFQKGNKFLQYLKSYQVQQIVVHNAHKLSHWGSFDERYLSLTQLKSYLKHVPLIAVSPMITPSLEKEIKSGFHLYEPFTFYANNLPEQHTYFVSVVQPHQSVQDNIQRIAKKHAAEKGILLTTQTNCYLPDNMSLVFDSGKTTFAVYAQLPDNLEQIYFFQREYGVHNIYVIYDERQLKQKKITVQDMFTQKLHQNIAIRRLEEVIQWCVTETCKKQLLQEHWKMQVTNPCGKCNICLSEQEKTSFPEKHTHDIQKLKDILITKRLSLAKSSNILTHQVFSDVTIEEIATYLPQNKQDLTYITGLGIKKIQLYGDILLDTVLDFCASNQISSNMKYLRETRSKIKYPQNSGAVLSVVKKAKINAAVQELGHWNSQLIYDFLNDGEITLAEIESITASIHSLFL